MGNQVCLCEKEVKFRELLCKYGVSSCYVSPDFDFSSDLPNGKIRIDVKTPDLMNALYTLFTRDGFVEEDQFLDLWFDDASKIVSNYNWRC